MLAQVTLKRCPTLKQHDFLKLTDISNQYNSFLHLCNNFSNNNDKKEYWLSQIGLFVLVRLVAGQRGYFEQALWQCTVTHNTVMLTQQHSWAS